jgi:NADPH:quinone reductase
MKAVGIHQFGGAEQLHLEEIEKPQPRADEVLIKNAAAGINYADIMLRSGLYLGDQQLPTIPGFEAAGIVEAVGANVTDWQVGQRVLALVREGGYAEYVVAHVSQLVPIPDGLAFGQATALLVQVLTAIALLRELQAGHRLVGAHVDQRGDRAAMKSQTSVEQRNYDKTSRAVVRRVLDGDAGCDANLRQW